MYCLCFNIVSFRGKKKKKLGPRPDLSPLGVWFKISHEHPHSFHMGSSSPGHTQSTSKTQQFALIKRSRRLYGEGHKLAPPPPLPPYKHRKFWQLCRAISSWVFNKSLWNLSVLIILRRSFEWSRRIFPNCTMSKVEKTLFKGKNMQILSVQDLPLS